MLNVAALISLQFVSAASTGDLAAPPADLPACPSEADSPDVAALLSRHERVLEGRSSIAQMNMLIDTPAWKRSLSLKVWSVGRDLALIRIVKGGPRETGLMTLKRQKQLWNYLPQAGRVMKLPSGMLGDSWLGSDFTNDDLVKGSSVVSDFNAKVEKIIQHEGQSAWLVVLTPRPQSTVVWSKVELVIDRKTCVPLEQRSFDEDGALARTMTFSQLKQIGWRTFPTRLTVTPADSERSTRLEWTHIEFDVDIADDTFSLKRLERGGD